MFLKQQISSFFRFFGLYVLLNCPMCGGFPFDGSPNMFCKDCFEKLPFIRNPVCPGCGGELYGILDVCPDCLHAEKKFPWKRAAALFKMDGSAKEVIYQYKYRKGPELARPLGRLGRMSGKRRHQAGSHRSHSASLVPSSPARLQSGRASLQCHRAGNGNPRQKSSEAEKVDETAGAARQKTANPKFTSSFFDN